MNNHWHKNVCDYHEEYVIDYAHYDALEECSEMQWAGDQERELYWLKQVNQDIDTELGRVYR